MTSDVGRWGGHGRPAGTATLDELAALRWREPRAAAALAQDILSEAAERGDAGTWLRAAGWLLHCRSAVGDAREIALDLLADVDTRAGRDVLRRPEAGRLRVELAALAQSNGDPDIARDLLDGRLPAGPDSGVEQDELELDRLAVLVRCALVDGADELAELRADVEVLARRLTGEPEALAELLLGSVHRADGEPAAAAERALRGLGRLGWTPADPTSPPRSPHLGCALLSQWATAVLEDGSAADVPDGVKQLDVGDGGRHAVLWRLAVARVFAGRARPTADVLEDAASAAAAIDAPSLEAACRSAQAELYEGAGHYQDALAAVRAAMEAERTDRERAERLREALSGPAAALAEPVEGSEERSDDDRVDATSPRSGRRPVTGDGSERPEKPAVSTPGSDDDRATGTDTAGIAGPAMATLDLGLGDAPAGGGPADGSVSDDSDPVDGGSSPERVGSVDAGGARPDRDDAAGRTGVGPDGADPDAAASETGGPGGGGSASWQLPGSRGVDAAASGDGEGSPLADAVLAELRDAVRDVRPATRPSDVAPASPGTAGDRAPAADTGTDGEPTTEAGRPTIVLELVDGDGRAVRHPDTDGVGAELASRAERLVPAGSEVRGPDGTGGRAVADSAVEVAVPGAEGVALHLWARSLVSHLAGRVSRRALPDGTVLRVRVHGPAGTVGEVHERALNGSSTSDRPRPRPRPYPAGRTDGATTAGPSGQTAEPRPSVVARLDVRPGSGGRRRRAAAGDGPTAPPARREAADGTARVNGASVHDLRRGASAQIGLGGPTRSDTERRRGRRRRAEDADAPGVDGAPVAVHGQGRPSRHAADPDGGADGTSSTDVGAAADADGARSPRDDDHPELNGRRRSRAGARRSAASHPGDAASAEGVASIDDAAAGIDAAPPGGDGASVDAGRAAGGPRGVDDAEPADAAWAGGAPHGSGGAAPPTAAGDAPDTVRAVALGHPDAGRSGHAGDGAAARTAHVQAEKPVPTGYADQSDDGRPGDVPPADDARDDATAPVVDGRVGTSAPAGLAARTDDGEPAGGTGTDGVVAGSAHDHDRAAEYGSRDRIADPWPAGRPDPLDTSIPVRDVVPDGAVRLDGEWVVPVLLEPAAVESGRNGVRSLDEGRSDRDVAASSADAEVGPAAGPTGPAVERAGVETRTTDSAGSHRADGGSPTADRAVGDVRSLYGASSGAPVGTGADETEQRGPDSPRVGSAAHVRSAGGSEPVADSADGAGSGRAAEPGRHTDAGRTAGRGHEPGDNRATAASGDARTEPEVGASPEPGFARDTGPGNAPDSDPGRSTGTGSPSDIRGNSSSGATTEPPSGTGSGSGTGPDAGSGAGATTDSGTSRREPEGGSSSRRDRRSRTEGRSGRGGRGRDVPATGGDPTAIPDDLGLGDLLAGALAAYRDI